MSTKSDRVIGAAAIALALLFNVPFTLLGMSFDYPDVLRRPAGEVLTRFSEGGAGLILTWHAFAWTALLFVPLAVALAIRADRLAARPALTVTAAIAGAFAGLVQAMGLWRWVFVVPDLARDYLASNGDDHAAEVAFAVINQYGGVAIGEHLGQLLTALFAALLGVLQWREGRRIASWLGLLTALLLLVGTNEGLAIALGRDGGLFGLITVVGFLGLSLWLAVTGISLIRGR